MRILVISNFYPPHYIGGYELGCRDAVEALKARGHEVTVLTSSYGLSKPESNQEIYRWLIEEIDWKSQGFIKNILKLLKKEISNQRTLKRLLEKNRPDVVYVWNLTFTSFSLAFIARELGIPVCFYIFDHWLTNWEYEDRWYRLWYHNNNNIFIRLGKRLLIFFLEIAGLLHGTILDLNHVQFASSFLKQAALQAGKPVADAKIIPWGIETNHFPYNPSVHNPPRLLFIGQIIPKKGVHTAIEAMKILVKKKGFDELTLTLVGGSKNLEYVDNLKNIVKTSGLEKNILFLDFVPHEKLLSIYQNHDIFLFPSVWDEPFGIVILEAMSCGLAVIGTATGGSREIIQADETAALVFPKENAEACTAQIIRLLEDPSLLERIRKEGRHHVEEKFRFDHTMDSIEKSLKEAIL
jgi:glycogen synthase